MIKQKRFFDELNKTGITDLAADYAEVGIDQLLDNGFLRELPGLKTIIGGTKGYFSIHRVPYDSSK